VVRWCTIPNLVQRAAQISEVNCAPLSVVMLSGTLNQLIQPLKKASAQALTSVEAKGTASAHLVALSTMVKR